MSLWSLTIVNFKNQRL